MGDVIEFIPKSEFERIRLIREARAIYDSIFPPTDVVSEGPDGRDAQWARPRSSNPIAFRKLAVEETDRFQVLGTNP